MRHENSGNPAAGCPRRAGLAAALALGLAGCMFYSPRYDARLEAGFAPPPPRVAEAPPPRAGFIWVPGYWDWESNRYVWREGRWLAQRPGYRWVPDRWAERHGRWRHEPGHWEAAGGT